MANREILNFTALSKSYYLLEPGEIIERKVSKETLPPWDYFQEGNLRVRIDRKNTKISVKRVSL